MLVIKQFGPVTYAMGTLQEILSGTGIAAKVRALPNDVSGCTLEMGADGLWTGNLGTLTQAQADALVAAGVMGNVKAGTPGTVNGSPVTWRGEGAGWVVSSLPDALPISSMRAVFIGDSQTQFDNIYLNGASQVQFASAWPTHLVALSGGRITALRNVAIGGQRSGQMLARFNNDVLALDPDTVFIAASINNTGLATLKPDIIEMVRRCRAYRSARVPSGVRVILVTTPPTGSYDGTYPAAVGDAQNISDMNSWKREFAAANGLGLIDFYSFFVDPTGTFKNGATTSDRVHPSNAWQKTSGQFAWDSIKTMFTVSPATLLPQANNDPNNLFPNAMMLPTQSARPSGWVAYGGSTVAESCGPVAGFRGNAFTVVNSGAVNQYYEKDVSLVGKTGNCLRFSFQAELNGGGGGAKWIGGLLNNQAAFQFVPTQGVAAGSEIVMEAIVPSGATGIRIQFAAYPGVTMRLGSIGLYDLTAIGAIP